MKNSACEGREGLDEETVKNAVASYLRDRGYTVAIGKKREHGPDMRATSGGLKLIVEAKGERNLNGAFDR